MAFKQILVPVDFSSHSEEAFVYAMHFAERVGAVVDVAHAFEVSSFFKSDFLVVPTGGGNALPVREAVRLEAKEHLDQLLATWRASGLSPHDSHLLAGSPAATISSFAGEKGYDLVVMGTRGHGGAAKLLLGSVAQRVIEHSPCPVITIMGGHKTRSLEKILVASDFSEHADAASRYAVDLAQLCQAALLLVHVYQPMAYPLPGGYMHYATLATDVMTAFEQQLLRAKEAALAAGAPDVQTAMPVGPPAPQIVEMAESQHCDLIVLGAQGRTGLERMFLGSTAERVVRSAHCPVLTVKADPAGRPAAGS